ncbi:MAG: DUF1080 domain-containing protein [Caulobacterales bacterium]|nr:DUF1080 domain-containing protein [Caulobacterales bacterium]
MRVLALAAAALALAAPAAHAEGKWRSIFNGHNLDGWVPKLNHRPAGDNWRDTFVVHDGVLKVSYAQYGHFNDEYGHLIYNRPLKAYRLRLEYRFVDQPTPGAQAWAERNSGVMLHGQAPDAMGIDQPYPVSVEAQILGGKPGETRPTGNVCTPGTTVSIGGVPMKEHCRNSTSKTYQDGEWVKFEVEVHGSKSVRQYVNGELVMEYTDLHLAPAEYPVFKMDTTTPAGQALLARGAAPLDEGYISLQGESTPIEFRKIELMELPE